MSNHHRYDTDERPADIDRDARDVIRVLATAPGLAPRVHQDARNGFSEHDGRPDSYTDDLAAIRASLEEIAGILRDLQAAGRGLVDQVAPMIEKAGPMLDAIGQFRSIKRKM